MFVPTTTRENTTEEDHELILDIFEVLNNVYDHMIVNKEKCSKYNFSFNCHSICRALYMFYGDEIVSLHDGTYRGVIEEKVDGKQSMRLCGCVHSWLKTTSGSIIDPYPVGILNPFPILYVNAGQDFEVHSSHYFDEPITQYTVFNSREVFKSSHYLLKNIEMSSGIRAACNQWQVSTPV